MLLQGIRLVFSIFAPQTVRMRTLTDPDLLRVWCSGRDQARQGPQCSERGNGGRSRRPPPPGPLRLLQCGGHRLRWAGGRGTASSDWLQRLRLLWLRLGSRGGSGSFGRGAPVPPKRALAAPRSRPRPLRRYRSCAPPGKLGSARAPPTRTSPGAPGTSSPSHGLCSSQLGWRSCGRESLKGECGQCQPPTGIQMVSNAKKSLP